MLTSGTSVEEGSVVYLFLQELYSVVVQGKWEPKLEQNIFHFLNWTTVSSSVIGDSAQMMGKAVLTKNL